jgi:integrase
MSVQKIKTETGETKWVARVYSNGRGSKRVSRRFDRKADADEFLQNYKTELTQRKRNPFKVSEFSERTFGEEAEVWIENVKMRYSPSYHLRAGQFLNELKKTYWNIQLARMTPEVISDIQRIEKLRGVEDGTVNRKIQVVIAILNFAVRQRRIPFNPAQGYTKLREQQKESRYWTTEEATEFLTEMDFKYPRGSEKRWVYAAYLLALNTGLRGGEIWGLKPDDLSTSSQRISVRRQFDLVAQTMRPTKNRKPRVVPCSIALLDELKEISEVSRTKTKIEARSAKPYEGTVFQNHMGLPVDHQNFVNRHFHPDVKKWGGTRIRFHDLRHTATTLMIANGVDIKTVKEICGHADISTTMNYVHLVASALDKVPELFSLAPLKS